MKKLFLVLLTALSLFAEANPKVVIHGNTYKVFLPRWQRPMTPPS